MKEIQDLLKDKIEKYEFQPLFENSQQEKGIESFEFQPLRKDQVLDVREHEKVIKIERNFAEKKAFQIAPIVKEHRGMNRQEELEKQRLIQEEVERQLIRVQDQAYKDGFEQGQKDGQNEVFDQTRAQVETKIESLNEMIEAVLKAQHDLIMNEKQIVFRTIKNLTKWVILRELKDDGDYILRLLEKLLSELQAKSNVLIQIDPKSFSEMPDVLEMIQEKVGKMKNVRIEIDYDIDGPGIIVESENGIINGSLTEQFKNLSKLFESVGHFSDEEVSPAEALDAVNRPSEPIAEVKDLEPSHLPDQELEQEEDDNDES